MDLIKQIRETAPAVDRVWEILDHPEEPIGQGTFTPRSDVPPIVVSEVRFGYGRVGEEANRKAHGGRAEGAEEEQFISEGETDQKDIPVLQGLDFTVAKGDTVALVGPSGGGKSTVLMLICGLYYPQQGGVSIYGQEIRDTDLIDIRKWIALVTQDTYLFPLSITENIAFGREGASREDIIEAARTANAHEFVEDLPNGYDTRVGERGVRFSGGQQQRIAIARAVLKDAPILLLDEPTSSLDTHAEALVEEALQRLMKNRTVLVIAHRLSTIKNADSVLVLDHGRIVEQGNHEVLMQSDTLYNGICGSDMMGRIMRRRCCPISIWGCRKAGWRRW